jgi:hypothetical protein
MKRSNNGLRNTLHTDYTYSLFLCHTSLILYTQLDTPAVISTSNPPNPFTDTDVANFITGLLNAGSLQEPDENSQILYCVIIPVGVNNATTTFIGEHSFFSYQDEEDPSRFDKAHFAWITNSGSLDDLTTIFSHELVESCTDPEGSGIQGEESIASFAAIMQREAKAIFGRQG